MQFLQPVTLEKLPNAPGEERGREREKKGRDKRKEDKIDDKKLNIYNRQRKTL